MPFKEAELAYGMTEDWCKAIGAGSSPSAEFVATLQSGEFALHPSIVYKKYAEGSTTQMVRLRKAVRDLAEAALASFITGPMSKVPGYAGQILVYTNVSGEASDPPPPQKPSAGIYISKHPLVKKSNMVVVEPSAWAKLVLAELSAPISSDRFSQFINNPFWYCSCAGCGKAGHAYLTHYPNAIELPRFFFETTLEKKQAVFVGKKEVNPMNAYTLGYCAHCRVKCGKCGKMLGKTTNPKFAAGLVADGVCPSCGADHLSNVPAPAVNRQLLVSISKRIIID